MHKYIHTVILLELGFQFLERHQGSLHGFKWYIGWAISKHKKGSMCPVLSVIKLSVLGMQSAHIWLALTYLRLISDLILLLRLQICVNYACTPWTSLQ